MQERLEKILSRFSEIGEQFAQPETAANPELLSELMKERAQLEPIVEVWQEIKDLKRQRTEAEELLQDPAIAEAARDEIGMLDSKTEAKTQELQLLLIPKDQDDDRNVVLEVRAGTGGDEASLFAAMLLRMYQRYAERHGWSAQVIDGNFTELGGVKEAILTVNGESAFGHLKFESGVHRVQRVPSTEGSGRIHTSTATVAVLPEAEDVEVEIAPGDLRIDVYRSTGHGGQCINTTDSAVRITHLPTGIVVTCQDEKSQIKNRAKALKVLKSRLYDRYRSEKDQQYASVRRGQIGTGDRSERIRTYNFPQGRVTDHRIGLTVYAVESFVDGDCDRIIEPLMIADQMRKLQEMSKE